jgi:hypothetical protein
MEKKIMSIFTNNDIFGNKKLKESSCFYTIVGEEDFINEDLPMRSEEDDKVYAKKITRSNGSIKYMIRLDYSAKLYNPFSIYDKEDKRQVTDFLNSVCRSNKKFKEVNGKVFDLYLKFLTTKNTSWLFNAEREAL